MFLSHNGKNLISGFRWNVKRNSRKWFRAISTLIVVRLQQYGVQVYPIVGDFLHTFQSFNGMLCLFYSSELNPGHILFCTKVFFGNEVSRAIWPAGKQSGPLEKTLLYTIIPTSSCRTFWNDWVPLQYSQENQEGQLDVWLYSYLESSVNSFHSMALCHVKIQVNLLFK